MLIELEKSSFRRYTKIKYFWNSYLACTISEWSSSLHRWGEYKYAHHEAVDKIKIDFKCNFYAFLLIDCHSISIRWRYGVISVIQSSRGMAIVSQSHFIRNILFHSFVYIYSQYHIFFILCIFGWVFMLSPHLSIDFSFYIFLFWGILKTHLWNENDFKQTFRRLMLC